MKLLYIAPRDFPRRVANRVQTIKMAEAFSKFADVTLLVSKLHTSVDELWRHYDVRRPFKITQIGSAPLGPQSIYSLAPSIYQMLQMRPDVVYFREELIGWLLTWFKRGYIYEMLDMVPSHRRYYPRLVRNSRKTVVISEGLKQSAIEAGLQADKFLVRPDAVDFAAFDIDISMADARKQVGLETEGKIVLYTGRFSHWKGTDTLIEAARYLPSGIQVILVGGFEGEPEVARQTARRFEVADRVRIVEFRPHAEMPLYMKAADLVVLPNLAENALSMYHTSPLKLFEYMAAQRPIVASDLPAIREVVDDQTATLTMPGDARQLASGICDVLDRAEASSERVAKAYKLAKMHTWDERARLILEDSGY